MSIVANILTGGSNSHETTSENANQVQTDFISEGVVGAITNTVGVAPATGAFAVNAQGTPDMTVAVSAGVAYVTVTPSGQASQTLRAYNNASANVTIAANSSGSTKYDWIYISGSAANAANPNTAGDNVFTLVASRSSSASSDDGTPPTYGYPIAVVTVANAASSITNGNIADMREVTGATPKDENAAGYKVDWYQEIGKATLVSAGDTITVSNIPARKYLKVIISLIATDGTLDSTLKLNNDTSTNYSYRVIANDTAVGGTSATSILIDSSTTATGVSSFTTLEIVNIATQPKLIVGNTTNVITAGAGTAPGSLAIFGQWVNTSNQISRIDITNGGTGDFAIGSEVIVLGHD